ncbi:hypothetical protein ES319_A11G243600v1 [Gossypium barbadense]|uniref:Uncharacterized protein n=1 Tax=Gossypium barbadense TaxID=3634 RepID=A0A5J5TW06_GOSBA|nr:hypothetical protein ES319_A11G243600v1 [Gossypium barbadense]
MTSRNTARGLKEALACQERIWARLNFLLEIRYIHCFDTALYLRSDFVGNLRKISVIPEWRCKRLLTTQEF